MNNPELRKYLYEGIKDVEGWCVPHLWNVIEKLDELQKSDGIDGPVCEIGVYHGKFLIGLLNTKRSHRKSLAIDVFEMQEFNLDGSGRGDYEKFTKNLEYFYDKVFVDIMKCDSISLGYHEIVDTIHKFGRFSMFSIDGCHDVGHTINDVGIAMQLTCPGGIIFVDDYYNAGWPGVHEGISKLYHIENPSFVPLCYTCNKLFLTDMGHHRAYLDAVFEHVRSSYPKSRIKKVQRYGWETLTIVPDFNEPILSR